MAEKLFLAAHIMFPSIGLVVRDIKSQCQVEGYMGDRMYTEYVDVSNVTSAKFYMLNAAVRKGNEDIAAVYLAYEGGFFNALVREQVPDRPQWLSIIKNPTWNDTSGSI